MHDIVAHVTHDYIRKLPATRDGQPMTGPQPGEMRPDFLAGANQVFVDADRTWSPRVLTDLLGHLGPQLKQMWAARGAAHAGLDRPLSHHNGLVSFRLTQ